MNDLTTDQLRRLLHITQQIDTLKKEKIKIMGGGLIKLKSQMSPAARKKIADSVKKRWKAARAAGRKTL